MNNEEQEEILDWVHNQTKSVALFIEPVGKGEYLDNNTLKANKKVYYDKLFKDKGLQVKKEGRFVWNDVEHEYEHYTHTDWAKQTVTFNRTYYWIVSWSLYIYILKLNYSIKF